MSNEIEHFHGVLHVLHIDAGSENENSSRNVNFSGNYTEIIQKSSRRKYQTFDKINTQIVNRFTDISHVDRKSVLVSNETSFKVSDFQMQL